MLKKAPSFVGAPIALLMQWVLREGLNVPFTRCTSKSNGSPVRLGPSLAAAALDGLFEHPTGHSDPVGALLKPHTWEGVAK